MTDIEKPSWIDNIEDPIEKESAMKLFRMGDSKGLANYKDKLGLRIVNNIPSNIKKSVTEDLPNYLSKTAQHATKGYTDAEISDFVENSGYEKDELQKKLNSGNKVDRDYIKFRMGVGETAEFAINAVSVGGIPIAKTIAKKVFAGAAKTAVKDVEKATAKSVEKNLSKSADTKISKSAEDSLEEPVQAIEKTADDVATGVKNESDIIKPSPFRKNLGKVVGTGVGVGTAVSILDKDANSNPNPDDEPNGTNANANPNITPTNASSNGVSPEVNGQIIPGDPSQNYANMEAVSEEAQEPEDSISSAKTIRRLLEAIYKVVRDNSDILHKISYSTGKILRYIDSKDISEDLSRASAKTDASEATEVKFNAKDALKNRSPSDNTKKGWTKYLNPKGVVAAAAVTGGFVSAKAKADVDYSDVDLTGTTKPHAGKENRKWSTSFTPEIEQMIKAAAEEGDIPEEQLRALVFRESAGNPKAYNKTTGASGLGQFVPGTAMQYGIAGENSFDPKKNLKATVKYMNDNKKELPKGIDPSLTNLYLSHQQGATGFKQLLSGIKEDKTWEDLSTAEQARYSNNGGKGMSPKEFYNMWNDKIHDDYDFANPKDTTGKMKPVQNTPIIPHDDTDISTEVAKPIKELSSKIDDAFKTNTNMLPNIISAINGVSNQIQSIPASPPEKSSKSSIPDVRSGDIALLEVQFSSLRSV